MAQAGEDILIYDFFKESPPGFFVEAGAYDGVTLSNTYLLESLGWKGLLVEAHPDYAKQCESNRPGSIVKQVALGPRGASGEVEFTCAENQAGAVLSYLNSDKDHIERCKNEQCALRKVRVGYTSLNDLLSACTDHVTFLSLDVEGVELDVLKGLDMTKYRPDLILIESNGRRHDEAIEGYLRDFGYCVGGRKGCNVFFVPTQMRERFVSLPAQVQRR